MRSNVYGTLRGSNGAERSMGGRANQDSISAWINSDNGQGSNCDIRVRAEVVGTKSLNGNARATCHQCRNKFAEAYPARGEKCPKCGADRQGQDTRKTVFTVELPAETFDGEACEVRIRGNNDGMRELAKIGAMFCGMKGAMDIADGNTAQGIKTMQFGRDTLKEMAEEDKKVPAKVTLPGGVSLSYALSCVEFCNRLLESKEVKS